MTAEVEEQALVVHEPEPSTAVVLWGTDDPRGMTARMTAVADALSDAVEQRGMTVAIQGRKYVKAEGWSMVGAMLGVFPTPREVEEMHEDGRVVGFRAVVDLVTRGGEVVGGAVAICTKDEPRWRDRDWNQIASMAQTRATAKAYRQTLGFIMPMAGYAPTPAEEMDGIADERPRNARPVEAKETRQCPEHGTSLTYSKRTGQWGHVLEDGNACVPVAS